MDMKLLPKASNLIIVGIGYETDLRVDPRLSTEAHVLKGHSHAQVFAASNTALQRTNRAHG